MPLSASLSSLSPCSSFFMPSMRTNYFRKQLACGGGTNLHSGSLGVSSYVCIVKKKSKNRFDPFFLEFFFFFDSKMCPKTQKMNLQKRYLEVSNSIRDGVRAFFRFTPERKKWEFFQMSKNVFLEILRCVVVLKVLSKKRNFFVWKTRSSC
jgi:hypothetical protein